MQPQRNATFGAHVEIFIHEHEKFTNPIWHDIQAVIGQEFCSVIWNRISPDIATHIEVVLLQCAAVGVEAQTLSELLKAREKIIVQAKASINISLWEHFVAHFWSMTRRAIEGLLERRASGSVMFSMLGRPLANMQFVIPVSLLPKELGIPQAIQFNLPNYEIRGVHNIYVPLDPKLGSPEN